MSLDRIAAWQRSVYRKAKQDRRHRFRDLHSLFSRPDWLSPVIESVLSRQSASVPGVDGRTAADYASPEKRRELMGVAQGALRGNMYVPQELRRTYRPKSHGSGKRPIDIATIQDRVIAQALKVGLEAIFEADFADCSTGFRAQRRVMDSISMMSYWIQTDYLWILLADVKNCFPKIDRDSLIELMEKRITDRQVLDLVHAFLDAGALDHGVFIETDQGVSQGFLLGPLLANIYLDQIDKWWTRRFHTRLASRMPTGQLITCWLNRYADNLAFACHQLLPDALHVQEELRSFVTTLGFDLSQDEIVNATTGLDHLGYHIRWIESSGSRGRLIVTASDERIERFKRDIAETLSAIVNPVTAIQNLNQQISSFGGEFKYVDSQRQFQDLDRWIEQKVGQVMTKEDVRNLRCNGTLTVDGSGFPLKKLSSVKPEKYRQSTGCPF